ncbi:unnamed protein product [Tetraodon nigroviridis]|uniref:(spotted green pufferfish) hypothetical protein n=1 Tax=Tetraodon nigroviridis TaxID=99883 RepID=Q4SJI7_TETNG|nr:unnamed protein product [Tetraodon nigroviridis]
MDKGHPPTSGTERARGHPEKIEELTELCWTLPHSLFLSICRSCHMQSNSSVNQEIYVLASSKSGSVLSSSPWVSSASDVILPETKLFTHFPNARLVPPQRRWPNTPPSHTPVRSLRVKPIGPPRESPHLPS